MFTSLILRFVPLILILFELTRRIQCTEYDERCYNLANREVCFFRPQLNDTWFTWYRATATCKRKNGNLPFIPDKAIQGVFEEYMNSLEKPFVDDMWMSGREARKKEWKWTNGRPFNEPTYFTETHSDYNSFHLQAILVNESVYIKEYLGNTHYYVCQFFGGACQARDAILLKDGCIVLNDGKLDMYDARNKCVEKGGDLAVIGGPEDLTKFRQVFSKIPKGSNIWLGLRRQWWTWNVTGSPEMKYTNWHLDNGFKPDLGCMVYEVNEYVWKQENCTAYKRFICQKGPTTDTSVEVSTTSTTSAEASFGFIFLIAGISSLVLSVLLVVIVIAITKKRKARQTRMANVLTDASYQHLEGRTSPKNNSTSEKQYTELQPPTKKPLLPTRDLPLKSQQSEQNPDYVYDEIPEPRNHGYIDIIH